ncbi:MAG: general secretion pathway protein GspN [Gammaproteobacteria bacterium]|nr:general secretion pathway protein GspN [Gammaproteobacteria bacterium]
MRAEAPGARTWLLGAVALWALALWLLAVFGMGGRIDRLPPDPALVQGLPVAAPPGEPRLGPLAQYSEFGDRPLFTTDRRPQPFVLNPVDEEAPVEFDFVLTSVLRAPGFEAVILQPSDGSGPVRLKVGEAPRGAPGWNLVSVAPRSAVFDGPEGERRLELRVFDGVGGEAPTPLSSAAPAQPAPGRAAPAPPAAGPAPAAADGSRPVVVTTSTSPVPTEVEVPAPGQADAAGEAPAVNQDEQVEAIRQRIEARRARLREQAQQGDQGQ